MTPALGAAGGGGAFRAAMAMVTASATTVVVAAVAFNFFDARRTRRAVAFGQRSAVATGTMTLFFAGFWGLLRFGVGAVAVPEPSLAVAMSALGTAVVIAGAAVNVAGRARLGSGWANQVTVYADHRLVTDGVFGLVRHPLYGSLVWMAFGASLEFANPLAALSTAIVFAPMMVHRAGQEERALAAHFPEYAHYRERVGMLFPRLPRRPAKQARS